jgi:hypothetical protein
MRGRPGQSPKSNQGMLLVLARESTFYMVMLQLVYQLVT